MFITQVYKYEKEGIVYVGGNVPQDATILETMDILNAEKGFKLEHKSDNKQFRSIWLKDGDTEENYIEVEAEEKKPVKLRKE